LRFHHITWIGADEKLVNTESIFDYASSLTVPGGWPVGDYIRRFQQDEN